MARDSDDGLPRLSPAAVTPIRYADVAAAAGDHLRGRGLETFERRLADFVGVPRVYTYTSFMRANYACLRHLKEREGDKGGEDGKDGKDGKDGEAVILPRYSCPSFAHGVLAAGLEVRYCDVDPRTLTIDQDHLRTLPTDDVLALLCVNHFGLANPMEEITAYCERNDVQLVEDLGYGLGTTYDGRQLGTFGDFSVLNFQEGKAVPVGGGAVAQSDESVSSPTDRDKSVSFSTDRDEPVAFPNERPKARPNPHVMLGYRFFSDPRAYYWFEAASEAIGTNVRKRLSMEDTIRDTTGEHDFEFDATHPLQRISDFQGSLGARVLDRLDSHRAVRSNNARRLEAGLADCDGVQLVERVPGTKAHYVRYPVLVEPERRDELKARLRSAGVEASSMYTEHGMDVDEDAFPGAAEVEARLLTLPCHPKVNDRTLERTISVLERHAGATRRRESVRKPEP